jgi:predicted heme/steroid binding protein
MPNIANISNNILTDSGVATSSLQPTITLTTTGTSGASTLISNTLNIPNYGSALTGYVPTSRQLSINGTAYDLSADRTWSVGTVTSVAALTLGTTGTDLSSTVATGTTTPVITLNVPTASAANRGALSAADWSTFNTKVGGVTATTPLFSSGGSTPNLTIQQSSGSQAGYLSSTDWTTFNNKQAAGNYITSLTGEATATGPGAAAVTLNNASVTGKVLTGVNITGGTILSTDSILTGFGKLQNQVNGLIGGSIYQGTWNAATNTPTLTSSVGTQGYYYIVSVAGTTNLNGITDWFVGDWAIFNGGVWQQVDNTDAVVSVNGQTGAVSLTTDNISEGVTNLYYTDTRARAALSFAAGSGAYNSTTGVITIPTNTSQLTNGANFITLASLSGTAPIVYSNTTGAISITQAGTASNGYLSSTDWNTFNNKQAALTNPVLASGSWTSNYIPKINGTYTLTNSLLYDGGSSIGVNTNAPYDSTQFKLDINGGLLIKNASGVPAQLVLINGNPATGGDNAFIVHSVGGIFTANWAQLQTYYGASVASGALRLQPTAGQILIGSTTASAFKVDITGTLKASGQLTLGSTITNGTYTYTLPGATGTLALTSQLTGGTVTSVAALTIGTTGTDLSSTVANSTTTPVITLNVPTASATNRGALSAADWTTFNNKQAALTNPVTGTGTTNYISKFTGTSTIGNSIIFDNGSAVGVNTNTPTYLFNVNQAADVWHAAFGDVTTTGQMLRIGGNASSGATKYSTLGAYINNSGNTGTLLVLQRDGGNVIIGGSSTVSDSGDLFQVKGNVQIRNNYNGLTRINIVNTTAGASSYVETSYTTDAAGNASIGKYSTTTTAYKFISASSSYIYNGGSGNLAIINDFATGAILLGAGGSSTAHLTITSGGLVGIGVAPTQSAALTFADSLAQKILFNNNANNYRIDLASAVAGGDAMMKFIAGSTGAGEVGFYTTTNLRMLITSGGNVIIGTTNTSTGHRLTVYSATETAQIRAAGAAPAILFTNTDTNTNSYSGYVGIVTAANNFMAGTAAGDMVVQNYSGYPILFGIGNVIKMRIEASGQLVLTSTISNGTYTYTLPGATGTLALTSDIPSLTGYVTLATAQTITGAKTISKEAGSYGGTVQSFLIDGAGGNGAITINSNGATSQYAYLNFAQNGVTKFEVGTEGAATNNGSLYFNHNIQVGSTGAAFYLKKSNGYVGINQTDPSYQLHVNTSANEGIFLKGSGAGVWMNIQTTGKLWSIGAQTDGFGVYQRTDSTYALFIRDNGFMSIGNATTATYKFNVYTDTDVWHMAVGGSTGQLRIGGQTGTGAVIQAYTPAGVTRNLYIQRDGGNVSIGTSTDTNHRLTVNSSTAAGQVRITGTAPTVYFTNTLTDPATYVGLVGLATQTNNFFTGTAAGDFVMYNSASGYKLFVVNYSGGVYLTSGATSWTANSDIRLKNINSHIDNAVEKLSTLQTINFSYKNDKFKKQNLGLIAQEVEKIFPELIDKNNEGMLGVRYTELVPVLIKAIQELKLEIETLKNK